MGCSIRLRSAAVSSTRKVYASRPGGPVSRDAFERLTSPILEMARQHASRLHGILHRTMAGEIRPVTLCARRPMLSESSGGRTDVGPMIGGQRRSWGPCAVVRAGGIDILVVTHAGQIWDQQQFKAFGIEPQAKRVVDLDHRT